MKPEDYLSEIEKSKIETFNNDIVLKNAVRKVLLDPLYHQGVLAGDGIDPTQNFALTPAFHMLLQKREMWDLEKLGAVNLANALAIQMIEQGFGALEGLNGVKASESPKKKNPAL